ncbi:hypothetical protein RB195_024609 [Necator americanus]|uniref:Uncharacterized protein n=1 Tax=Necator americanus TaxID=51031 RepID=A0ABR1ENV1_NECAM
MVELCHGLLQRFQRLSPFVVGTFSHRNNLPTGKYDIHGVQNGDTFGNVNSTRAVRESLEMYTLDRPSERRDEEEMRRLE